MPIGLNVWIPDPLIKSSLQADGNVTIAINLYVQNILHLPSSSPSLVLFTLRANKLLWLVRVFIPCIKLSANLLLLQICAGSITNPPPVPCENIQTDTSKQLNHGANCSNGRFSTDGRLKDQARRGNMCSLCNLRSSVPRLNLPLCRRVRNIAHD